jgi:hypothetical protein
VLARARRLGRAGPARSYDVDVPNWTIRWAAGRGLAERGVVIDNARQSFNLILGFGLSIPVFFLTPYAWVLWIAVPLLVSRWHHLRRKRDLVVG